VRAAAIDPQGVVVSVVKRPVTDRTPSLVAAELATAAREALARAGVSLAQVTGVGVGVAGQVLGSTGLVLVGPNLGWRDVRFGALLERELARPVRVVNDLSAAAWGESRVGAARGASDVVLIFVGSGVGAGLILGGRMHEGAGGIAGEFGHVKVIPGGRVCGCGERGCLEAYVGGHNIAARIRELHGDGQAKSIVKAAGGDLTRVGGSVLEIAAAQGDPEAIELREDMARLLGVAAANVVTLLNPQKLILGGGVLQGMPGLKTRMIEWIRDTGGRAHVAQLSIVDAALGDDAGVIGAGLLGAAG
jgi:glucokinase